MKNNIRIVSRGEVPNVAPKEFQEYISTCNFRWKSPWPSGLRASVGKAHDALRQEFGASPSVKRHLRMKWGGFLKRDSGQFHALAALLLGQGPRGLIEYKTGHVPTPLRTQWQRNKLLSVLGSENLRIFDLRRVSIRTETKLGRIKLYQNQSLVNLYARSDIHKALMQLILSQLRACHMHNNVPR